MAGAATSAPPSVPRRRQGSRVGTEALSRYAASLEIKAADRHSRTGCRHLKWPQPAHRLPDQRGRSLAASPTLHSPEILPSMYIRGPSGPHAGYIEQHARFQFLLVKPVLHQIADADDAFQLLVLDHR